MANNCYFEMKIAGEEKAVEEFVQMLRWEGPFKQSGLGRVYSFDVDLSLAEKDPDGRPFISVQGQGDCAWSIKTAMIDTKRHPLLEEIKRLGLAVEAYSSEPGVGFQEHYLIVKDEVLIDECVDYEEHWIEGAEESYIQQVMEEHTLTREELMGKVNDSGDYCIGGYDDFGDFDDLFSKLEWERKPALDDVIQDANNRAAGNKDNGREPEHENVRE